MGPRIEVIKGFLSEMEVAQLNAWAQVAIEKKWLDACSKTATARLTTRMYGDRFETPLIALTVFDRIKSTIGHVDAPVIEGHGRDGIVVSYTKTGGSVSSHCDPFTPQGASIRCNIITQNSEDGGDLYVYGKRVDVSVGDLHCYAVSAWQHWLTEVKGQTPRILWMFGLGIDLDEWESGSITLGDKK